MDRGMGLRLRASSLTSTVGMVGGQLSELNFRITALLIFSKGTKGHSLNCPLEYFFSLQRDSVANESFLLNS